MMKPLHWKIVVVILVIGIIFTFGWSQSFYSINKSFFTHPTGPNGTAIVVYAVNDVSVNGLVQISSLNGTGTGQSTPVTVMFENGTKVLVSPSNTQFFNDYTFSVHFHMNGSLFQPGMSQSGGIANVSISSSNPLAVAAVSNISEHFFLTELPRLVGSGNGVTVYMIYIDSYASVNVRMVGGALE